MNFHTANIDHAIVITQYDLRGFDHPFPLRYKYKLSGQDIAAITRNFMSYAAGGCDGNGEQNGKRTDENYADYSNSSFEDYLSMCERLAKDCDNHEKEAIQFIVRKIVMKNEEMRSEVAAGKRNDSACFNPLDKGNRWGKAVLALVEAFEVKLEVAA